jgi:hypothetical protein
MNVAFIDKKVFKIDDVNLLTVSLNIITILYETLHTQ